MKNYKDMYPENMIIEQLHEKSGMERMLNYFLKQRKLNSFLYIDDSGVFISLTRKDEHKECFCFTNFTHIFDIMNYISTYVSEHGGIKQWQIPKN